MKFRRYIGIASLVAVLIFISNPEVLAFSFMVSSIGFDVFLLFLSFQFKDYFSHGLVVAQLAVAKLRSRFKASRPGN